MSQLPATVEFVSPPWGPRRSLSSRVRARPARRSAGGARDGYRGLVRRHRFVGPSATHRAAGSGCRALRPQIMGQPSAGPARLLAAAPLLPRRGLGHGHVSGAAALAHHAQLAYRHGRQRGRQYAPVRGDRRRHFPAHRFQGQSRHPCSRPTAKSQCGARSTTVWPASAATSATTEGRAAIARAGQARTMAQHTYRHRAAEILGFVENMRAPR